MGISQTAALLKAKSITIYQTHDKYTAWVRTGNEERVFELRYSPAIYAPDTVRNIVQQDNIKAVVSLHI